MRDAFQKKVILFGAILLCCFVFPAFAHAASISLSPSSGDYEVGKSFSVSVYVSSADQAMNAASGVVSFPADKMTVTSLSKGGSIMSLWVQEPSYSNTAGTVSFEGIVLNPGFTGASGKILTINFKIKAAGSALLNFSTGSILANDGSGTNILTGMGSAQFSFGGAAPTVPDATTPSVVSGTPAAPQISSATHPDPNKWYNAKDASFGWTVSMGISADRVLIGKIPNATPTVVYSPAINSKTVTQVDDGIWYFHVQLKNTGGWGAVSHFRFQIDTQAPAPFEIKFAGGNAIPSSAPTATFEATDKGSGIDYYKVKIGDGEFVQVSASSYTLPPQTAGKHSIVVQAFDKAGNYTTSTADFEILAIKAPVITDYPAELQVGDTLTVSGLTEANSAVTVWLQKDKDDAKSTVVSSDKNGKFSFTADQKVSEGIYQVWAEVVDSQGAKSNPSAKVTVPVASPRILKIGGTVLSFLVVVVPALAIVLLFIVLLIYLWRKLSRTKKRVRRDVRNAESAIHLAFDKLKENVQAQVKLLEKTRNKRELTEEEEKIVKRLKKNLDEAERVVKKGIKEIEKEVE